MQNINPLELFKEELDTDEIASRINTIHKLPIVATLMTPDAIKNSLIPYLDTLVKKEDDEVVFAITEQFTTLAGLLGAQHTLVLPYLESLCAHDETVIRERAVTSISKLLAGYTDNEINNFIIPLIIRLSSNEANFTNRASAALLMSSVYPRAGQNKDKIRQKFIDISNEEMLLLQRVTALKIPEMCQVYEKEYVLSDLINILKHRFTDEQDQIRVLAIQSFKSVSKLLTRDENKTFIMPLIIQAADDKSWRVRLALSQNFTDIAKTFGDEVTDSSLIQTYENLLKDSEVEVKIEAVKLLGDFILIVNAGKVHLLINQVLALGKDPLSLVRSYVGGVISVMVKSIPKDQSYQNIQPLIKDLMKDDQQEVRKGGIVAAIKFIEVLGCDTIPSLHASLKQCSEDPKWRVRLELIKNVAVLSVKLESNDIFLKHLEPLFGIYLKDRAAAIRKLGASKVRQLGRVYSGVWLNSFVQKLTDILQKEPSYYYKISAVYSLKEISLVSNYDGAEKCITMIFKASHDNVPNVREVTVKCLKEIALGKTGMKDAIKKHLSAMIEDSDKEVRELATEAHSKL